MTHKNTDLTQLSIRALHARRRRLAKGLPDVEGVVWGSVATQGRRCGKEGCKCARGELHGPYTYLTLPRSSGPARIVYVPAAMAEELRRRVQLSGRVQAALEEISAINVELLARRELD
ncbi:MAG: DUF6788 family protein [Actinomycetota bacterium]